jgi:DNA (cytosine-5)-methyltransferase 1
MVKYVCQKCEKDFKQKSQYERHIQRVYPCTNNSKNVIITPTNLPLEGLKFIDLFCGIGGFHVALSDLGAKCVLACDIDKKCREVYRDNFGLEPKEDVKELKTEEIPEFDILCGGFPCQAFSHAGHQGGFEDTRGTLFREICRILRDCKPAYFLLENVKNLRGHDGGKTIKVIYDNLHNAGYITHDAPILLSPHHLGVPQHRERVFLLGIRADLAGERLIAPFPAVSPTKTDIATILEPEEGESSLPHLSQTDQVVIDLWDTFLQHFKTVCDKLPGFPLWSDDWDSTYDIKDLPEWKQAFIKSNRNFYKEHKEFLEPWLTAARKNTAFTGARRKFEWQCGNFTEGDNMWNLLFTFRPSGIRTKRTNYSPALVAMAQIIHVGSRRRKLTPREVARLQSYPDSFKIHPSSGTAYKQFGNSVNVEVIKRMAKFLVKEMLAS